MIKEKKKLLVFGFAAKLTFVYKKYSEVRKNTQLFSPLSRMAIDIDDASDPPTVVANHRIVNEVSRITLFFDTLSSVQYPLGMPKGQGSEIGLSYP